MLKSGMRSGGMTAAIEPLAQLPTEGAHAGAHLGGPGQKIDRALVEAEVVCRAHHGAVFNHVDAVTGQSGQERRGGIDLPDVPQARQEQAAFRAGHHLVDRPAVPLPVPSPPDSARRIRLSMYGAGATPECAAPAR